MSKNHVLKILVDITGDIPIVPIHIPGFALILLRHLFPQADYASVSVGRTVPGRLLLPVL